MSVQITYFVHGTTTDNEAARMTGWLPGVLSAVGQSQAAELGRLVAGETFDVIFCSDLQRAVDSAELGFGGMYRIIPDKRLRECNYGSLNGATDKEVGKKEDHISQPFPNGESYRDVEARVRLFLDSIKARYAGKHIAIVAHQAPQLALEVIVHGKSWPQAFAEDWRKTKSWQPGWEYIVED